MGLVGVHKEKEGKSPRAKSQLFSANWRGDISTFMLWWLNTNLLNLAWIETFTILAYFRRKFFISCCSKCSWEYTVLLGTFKNNSLKGMLWGEGIIQSVLWGLGNKDVATLCNQSDPLLYFWPFEWNFTFAVTNRRELKQRRRRCQRERLKSNRTGVDWQNNNFARASRLFVHFFAVTARLWRENA